MSNCLYNFDDALQTSFVFKLNSSPSLSYSTQSVNFPSLSVGEIQVNHKNYRGYVPDNVVVYEDLTITFIVSEDFSNYSYLYNKMQLNKHAQQYDINEVFDELHVFRLGSNKKAIADIVFHKAFCTNLSGFDYNVNVTDEDPLVCTATFKYQTFSIEKV